MSSPTSKPPHCVVCAHPEPGQVLTTGDLVYWTGANTVSRYPGDSTKTVAGIWDGNGGVIVYQAPNTGSSAVPCEAGKIWLTSSNGEDTKNDILLTEFNILSGKESTYKFTYTVGVPASTVEFVKQLGKEGRKALRRALCVFEKSDD